MCTQANGSAQSHSAIRLLNGVLAVLGIDIVSFSTLEDGDQVIAVQEMYSWIGQALRGEGISDIHYRWSPAGDGGYITFDKEVSSQAIDVAFSILKKSKNSAWTPRNRTEIQLRFALSLGMVQEGEEIGGRTNIWGLGINRTARMLTVSSPSQILVAKEYYDLYIKPRREKDFKHGDFYTRTVKHGERIEIMNFTYNDLGLEHAEADASRWYSVGHLWKKTIEDYQLLIEDAMTSGKPLAAIAAARFLLDLNCEKPVEDLCSSIYEHGKSNNVNYPKIEHKFFSQIPNRILYQIICTSKYRHFNVNDVICMKGEESNSTFFLISGRIKVEDVSGRDDFIGTPDDEIFGEFGLFATMRRTATLKAFDECLLLEINNKVFRKLLLENSLLAEERIRSIISSRVIENLRQSETLFPQPKRRIHDRETLEVDKFRKIDAVYDSATCLVLKAGEKLILDNQTSEGQVDYNNSSESEGTKIYVIFNGKAKIYPTGNRDSKADQNENDCIEIIGRGETGAGQIVGLFDKYGKSIDGKVAEIVAMEEEVKQDGEKKKIEVKEALVICLDSDRILRLINGYSDLEEHWDGLCGKRFGAIRRMRRQKQRDYE